MSDNSLGSGIGDLVQYVWAGGAGIMGRVMYHAHLIQQGKRKPLLWVLCDLAIALGMGWIVLGLCNWVGMNQSTMQSLAIMAGWAGPHMIDQLIARALDKYLGPKDKSE